MPENDIYDNEARFERFSSNLKALLVPPSASNPKDRKRKYWIKNAVNLKHYRNLFKIFDANDTSYIRRLRLSRTLLMVCSATDKDIETLDRPDIDSIMAFAHKANHSPKSKRDFILDIKFIWRQLFGKDEKGRQDSNVTPYAVRHLSGKIDKAKEKLRGDRFTLDDFEKLVQAFADDPRMQAILTLSFESLARPQELLMRNVGDLELYDNYGKLLISSHGKEGTGFLRIIDSFYYVSRWLNLHPLKHDKAAPLFINMGRTHKYDRMSPFNVNKMLRDRCVKLGLSNRITLYSLKRNGVTLMRLSGKSDNEIQRTARWTTTKQLHVYDMGGQEEAFKVELAKRGIIQDDKLNIKPQSRKCSFCETINGIAESVCAKCRRPLDREAIEKEARQRETELTEMKAQLQEMQNTISIIQRFGSAANRKPGQTEEQLYDAMYAKFKAEMLAGKLAFK